MAPIETTRHAFIDRPQVTRAWAQFNSLRHLHDLPMMQFTPADILEGAMLTYTNLHRSKFSNNCSVTQETPWDILRCLILRNIWCQRCNMVMRNEPFHLGTTLYRSWRTVIQIRIAAWHNIWKNPETAPERIATFHSTWTANPAFCIKADTLVWQFLPDTAFLPQDLASTYTIVGGTKTKNSHFHPKPFTNRINKGVDS